MSEATMRESRRPIQVSGPIYRQLKEIKTEREARLKREVSFSEIIEEWRDVWAEVTK